MSELGDSFRDYREYRRKMRATWVECPTCAQRYGTGTKVPPGRKCRNCGWKAPAAPTTESQGEGGP